MYVYCVQLFEEHIKRNQDRDIRKPKESFVPLQTLRPASSHYEGSSGKGEGNKENSSYPQLQVSSWWNLTLTFKISNTLKW